ncbi:hypothetical protein ACFPAF_16380 [Hymenobacter endophyticus]|uniref:Uncharacterized protein n=1 Tax=Hymenobacter endophyticus TaxID=3076335 RepID=A0ABU3TKT3_9BACT|nr:hypothetical protein [Hymenobacter endophyticus]MDU0371980.1 hypothetical protein [Hymenobacter endophyticus]
MSQHLFDAFASVTTLNKVARPVEVFCGWDRPDQRHFLVVEDMSDEAQEQPFPQYVFSNLRLPGGGQMTAQNVVDTLVTYGISVPDGLLEALQEDQQQDKGEGRRNW